MSLVTRPRSSFAHRRHPIRILVVRLRWPGLRSQYLLPLTRTPPTGPRSRLCRCAPSSSSFVLRPLAAPPPSSLASPRRYHSRSPVLHRSLAATAVRRQRVPRAAPPVPPSFPLSPCPATSSEVESAGRPGLPARCHLPCVVSPPQPRFGLGGPRPKLKGENVTGACRMDSLTRYLPAFCLLILPECMLIACIRITCPTDLVTRTPAVSLPLPRPPARCFVLTS